LAKLINDIVCKNSSIQTKALTISLNKDNPWGSPVTIDIEKNELENGYIFLIDDVINSGKTLLYALTEMLNFPTKAIKTVTLIDRRHRRFPIKADFVGLTLSTTLKEHVKVNFDNDNFSAYLK